jgi:hypothetical protein
MFDVEYGNGHGRQSRESRVKSQISSLWASESRLL